MRSTRQISEIATNAFVQIQWNSSGNWELFFSCSDELGNLDEFHSRRCLRKVQFEFFSSPSMNEKLFSSRQPPAKGWIHICIILVKLLGVILKKFKKFKIRSIKTSWVFCTASASSRIFCSTAEVTVEWPYTCTKYNK